MLKLGADDPELQSEVIENVYQVKRLESTAGDLLDKFASETANLENAHEVKQYLRLDQISSDSTPFDTFSEMHFWPTDPKIFLKAPLAPIYTNFEGERASKKTQFFCQNFSKSVQKRLF